MRVRTTVTLPSVKYLQTFTSGSEILFLPVVALHFYHLHMYPVYFIYVRHCPTVDIDMLAGFLYTFWVHKCKFR